MSLRTYLLGACCFFYSFTNAQKINTYLRERAQANLKYLAKHNSILRNIKIDDHGIHLLSFQQGDKDLSVYWGEMPYAISLLENASYHELIKAFELKGKQVFHGRSKEEAFDHYREYPDNLTQLRVAIDPGHFGGDMEEARLENRMVRIDGTDLGVKQDIEFFESHLTYTTAIILKDLLESKGVQVKITRTNGTGAVGKDFGKWLSEDFVKQVKLSFENGDITSSYKQELTNAFKDSLSNKSRYVLFNFYKFIDFRARVESINSFKPDITIVIHYNAHDENRAYGDRFLKPVQDNYNMVFVPGAFLGNEAIRLDHKLDLVRLLVSPDLSNAVTLADLVLQEQEKLLSVGRALKLHPKVEQVSLPTGYDGVFARNLAINRMVRGIVIYGESLLQDNANEALLLSRKDFSINDGDGTIIKTSRRCQQVAESYFNAIVRFIENNKLKNAALGNSQEGE